MWIIYAIISAFWYSINHIINKFILNYLNTWNTVFFTSFFVAFLLFLFFLFSWEQFSSLGLEEFLIWVIASITWFVALWSLFRSFEFISIWESIAIANIFPFLIVLFVFLSYQEGVWLFHLIWMSLVFFWIFLISKQDWSFKISLDTKYAFITAIGWAFYNFAIDYFVRSWFSILQVSLMFEVWVFLSSLLYILFNFWLPLQSIRNVFLNQKLLLLCFLSGLSTAAWTYFTVLAMSYIPVSIVGSIVSSQVVFSALLGYFVLSQKLSYLKLTWILIVFVWLVLYNFI